MYDDAHAELHANIAGVPVPDWHLGQFILSHFEPVQGDYFKTVDNLLMAIETTKHNRHFDAVQCELGQLMVTAIDLQRPYVREGYCERALTA